MRVARAVAITAVFAALGYIIIVATHAATFSVSDEAENGLLSGATVVNTLATASGGKAIAFGGGTNTTNTPMGVWKAALANRATAPAKWLAIGESLTEGQGASTRAKRFINLTRDQLRTNYPVAGAVGGENYIPALYRVYAPDSTWDKSASKTSGSIANDFTTGDIGYRSYKFGSGASVTYPVSGDSADIWYATSTNSGSFSYKIDNGAATTVSATGTAHTDNLVKNVSLGTAGSHTITITAVSGSFTFEGITGYNGDRNAGIQLYDSGWSAATVAVPFLQNITEFQRAVAAVGPQLVTIELGGNDYENQTNLTTFKSQMQQLINSIKTQTPVPSILLIVPYQINEKPNGTLIKIYGDQLKAIAAADPTHIAVLDLGATLPAADTSGRGYYVTDGIHPNDSGQKAITDLLYKSLTQ